MIPKGSGRWILLGICSLFPLSTPEAGAGQGTTPNLGTEAPQFPAGDSPRQFQGCGVTFHTRDPCGIPGPSRRELEQLRELLEATKGSLRLLEEAMPEKNRSRLQDLVAEAIPAIHEANLEFRESLENVRRELEEHGESQEEAGLRRRKEELRNGLRLLSHLLLLTGRLAQSLESASQRIHAELSRSLRSRSEP